MSDNNEIGKEDLDKMQELLKKSAEDIALKEKELTEAKDQISELQKSLGSKEQELSKTNEELKVFKKEKEDAMLSEHIEVMKAAGKVAEDAKIDELMDSLRGVSEETLAREAELLKELAEANKKAEELSKDAPARKTQLSDNSKKKTDELRNEVYKMFGAEDLLSENAKSANSDNE